MSQMAAPARAGVMRAPAHHKHILQQCDIVKRSRGSCQYAPNEERNGCARNDMRAANENVADGDGRVHVLSRRREVMRRSSFRLLGARRGDGVVKWLRRKWRMGASRPTAPGDIA